VVPIQSPRDTVNQLARYTVFENTADRTNLFIDVLSRDFVGDQEFTERFKRLWPALGGRELIVPDSEQPHQAVVSGQVWLCPAIRRSAD